MTVTDYNLPVPQAVLNSSFGSLAASGDQSTANGTVINFGSYYDNTTPNEIAFGTTYGNTYTNHNPANDSIGKSLVLPGTNGEYSLTDVIQILNLGTGTNDGLSSGSVTSGITPTPAPTTGVFLVASAAPFLGVLGFIRRRVGRTDLIEAA